MAFQGSRLGSVAVALSTSSGSNSGPGSRAPNTEKKTESNAFSCVGSETRTARAAQ